MSELSAPEPTMEEILASIRRIISEDDGGQPASSASGETEPPHGDMLELTDKLDSTEPPPLRTPQPATTSEAPAAEPIAPPRPALAPAPRREPPKAEPAPPALMTRPEPSRPTYPTSYDPSFGAPSPDAGLVSPYAAERAAAQFSQLAQSIAMPAHGRSLEDLVRELLNPLLRDWLDQHLTAIVEAKVQAEVERIARGGR